MYTLSVSHDQLQGYLIGTPLPNTQAWVLDRRRRLAPIGVPGELYLGGAGLARGYLHRPELTAERFVPNPIGGMGDGGWKTRPHPPSPIPHPPSPSTRLYRTGDLVRYRPDGTLEFLGRTDEQVKIRGFRIEPGEIEAALGQHPAVQACAVVAREDQPGEVRLVAYLVTSDKSRVTSEGGDALVTRYSLLVTQLRAFLQQKLPEYMLPAAFVPLEVLPLTRNGKLDRRALPAPEQSGTTFQETYIAPRDTLEFQLTRIWEELLGVRPIGVSVNFFDLGGHSLLAVSLMAQIQRRFARDLPLSALFQGPTIEQLAYLLQQDSASLRWSPVVPIQTGGAKPPFFCVHPAGGQVLCYVDLARHLGSDHPFYGIQARGLYGEQLPYTHIEDMAEHYIAAMRVVQPHGPYFLGGWSFGSVVAFEIAQQLQRQGQEVGLLVMLDSEAPIPDAEADPRDDAAIDAEMLADMIGKENLPMSYDAFLRLDPHEQMNCLLERARKAKAIPLGIGAPEVRRFLRLRKAHAQALTSYTPHVYPNRITLFKAESPMESMDTPRPTVGVGPTDITLGWSALSCLPITVCTAPGTHATMLNEPHVRVLADLLRAYLDASQSTLAAAGRPASSTEMISTED